MRKTLLAATIAVAVTLATGQAQAAPITTAGDYVFTGGLTGTFTSDGTKLTKWSFTGNAGILWDNTLIFGAGGGGSQAIGENSTTRFISGIVLTRALVRVSWADGTWGEQGLGFCSPFSPCGQNGTFTAELVTSPPPPPPVPEPVALTLMAFGTLGLGVLRRRTA
ncbi:hypothetical protein TBR22_A01120 [Luteitalea sp. TBR-22]|uniref:hypothetical protein n=1 Tax=Luteitalea sp. TBR-22 TaxID=2802971 RepID=UPI001AFA4203|nr:hypothetical protein [Luteitalea sp. TBR-22]BCS30911.1 hypothetical protein TBR22_A01120 [Luteitalea sp. TBR-22]